MNDTGRKGWRIITLIRVVRNSLLSRVLNEIRGDHSHISVKSSSGPARRIYQRELTLMDEAEEKRAGVSSFRTL